VKTPCVTYSESGRPTGGGPCAEFVDMRQDRDMLFSQAAEDSVVICRLKRIIAKERQDRDALRTALTDSGIPAQARLDDKAPPLRITVERAREIMGMVGEGPPQRQEG
jgi:hypothetical protein